MEVVEDVQSAAVAVAVAVAVVGIEELLEKMEQQEESLAVTENDNQVILEH